MRREISVYTKINFCIYGNFPPHIPKEIAVYTHIFHLPFFSTTKPLCSRSDRHNQRAWIGKTSAPRIQLKQPNAGSVL